MPETQNEFKDWARVEVMGHQTHIGFVTTEAYGQAVMFRIEQPALPEEERTLLRDEYTAAGHLPCGTVVKMPAVEGVSVLVGSGSIYRIIPCTQAVVLKAVRDQQRRPLTVVRLPEGIALPASSPDQDDQYDQEDEEL